MKIKNRFYPPLRFYTISNLSYISQLKGYILDNIYLVLLKFG